MMSSAQIAALRFSKKLNESAPLESTPKPVHVRQKVTVEESWICPHCDTEIGEKALFSDLGAWYHRGPCADIGPILLPQQNEAEAPPARGEPRLKLDLDAAREELKDAHDDTMDLKSANSWASRSIVAYEMSLDQTDLKEKVAYLQDGEDYFHESKEHSGLVSNGEQLLREVVDAVEPYRTKAWAAVKA